MKVTFERFLSQSAEIEQVLDGMAETTEVIMLKKLVADLRQQLILAKVEHALEEDAGDDSPIKFVGANINYAFLCQTYEPSDLRAMQPNPRLQTCIALVNWCTQHDAVPLQHWQDIIANNGSY